MTTNEIITGIICIFVIIIVACRKELWELLKTIFVRPSDRIEYVTRESAAIVKETLAKMKEISDKRDVILDEITSDGTTKHLEEAFKRCNELDKEIDLIYKEALRKIDAL